MKVENKKVKQKDLNISSPSFLNQSSSILKNTILNKLKKMNAGISLILRNSHFFQKTRVYFGISVIIFNFYLKKKFKL